jgi:hypothetical protein
LGNINLKDFILFTKENLLPLNIGKIETEYTKKEVEIEDDNINIIVED